MLSCMALSALLPPLVPYFALSMQSTRLVNARVQRFRALLAAAFVGCWLAPLLLTRSERLMALLGCRGCGCGCGCWRCARACPMPVDAPARHARSHAALSSRLSTESAAFLLEDEPAAAPAAMPPMPALAEQSSTAILRLHSHATLAQMTRTCECWLVVLVVSTLFGAGMMVSTNLAQLLAAKRHVSLTGRALTLFSCGSTAGRLGGGLGADMLRGRARVPASGCLLLDLLLMMAGHALLALAEQAGAMLWGVLCAGLAFGAAWPHVVLVTAECFGKTHLGANYGFFDGVCQAVGSLLLANLLPGYVYAAHSDAVDGRESECYGRGCFAWAHGAIVGLCAVAMGASVLLLRLQSGGLRGRVPPSQVLP
jgi:hypothetical protein